MLSADECPANPPETAVSYILKHLSPADTRAFEDHCITCSACTEVVQQTDEYIEALRAAGHLTKD